MASEFGLESAFLVVRVVANDGLPYINKVEIVPDPNIAWPDQFYAVVYQVEAATYEEARKKILQAVSILNMLKWARPWLEENPEACTARPKLWATARNASGLMAALSRFASVIFEHECELVTAGALVIEKGILDGAAADINTAIDILTSGEFQPPRK